MYEPFTAGVTDTAIAIVYGFTGPVEGPAVRRGGRVFAQRVPMVTLSFRGHRAVLDPAPPVDWARAFGHSRVAAAGFSKGGSGGAAARCDARGAH